MSDDLSLTIPFDLTNRQRAEVHEYAKQNDLTSRSVALKGSNNKMIIIQRPDTQKQIQRFSVTPELVGLFAQYMRVPFPCNSLEYYEYYLKLFDQFYNTIASWDLFIKESNEFSISQQVMSTSKKIEEVFLANDEYQKLMTSKMSGVSTKMSKDVYTINNIGMYFMSIDIRSANFTVLRDACPSIFAKEGSDELLSWPEFVKKFTPSEFLSKSKYFRELVFGLTSFIKRAGTLQEIFMDKIHPMTQNWASMHEVGVDLRMKCGDELVYQLSDYNKMVSLVDSLKEYLGESNMQRLHIRIFRVDLIATKNYFIKTFVYNTDWIVPTSPSEEKRECMVEFKKVPKYFMPQIIKWYQKKEIVDEDLIFMHEGVVAKYMSTIFE